jgi:hypothetical protein
MRVEGLPVNAFKFGSSSGEGCLGGSAGGVIVAEGLSNAENTSSKFAGNVDFGAAGAGF